MEPLLRLLLRMAARFSLISTLALASLATGASAQTRKAPETSHDTNIRAYVELLRGDVRTQKVAILTELMDLTEAEDAAFWPIYRDYAVELTKINDDRIALIDEYGKEYSHISDDTADRLARRMFDLQDKRQQVLEKCYERMKAALSPKVAVRFLQVEHQLLTIMDLQISAALPVVK